MNGKEITCDYVKEEILNCSNARILAEKDWFENDLFSQLIHNVYFDVNTGSLRNFTFKDGSQVRVIDKYNVILNGLVNSLTKNTPVPEARIAYGEEINDEIKKEVKVANIFLSGFWKNEGMKQGVRDVVKDGFKKGMGWIQVTFNDSDKNGIGEVNCNKQSTWSIYADPNGYISAKDGTFEGRYMIKEVLCDIYDVKNNPEYLPARENVTEYVGLDPNITKAQLMRITNNVNVIKGRCVVQEIYYRKYSIETMEEKDADDNITKKKYQKLRYFRKVFSDQILLKEEEKLDLEAYPFFCFQPIREDGALYLRPWMSKVIPLNKTLDVIVSKMEMRARTMNVGRILKHKNTTVDILNDKEGQIVEWNGNRPPESAPITPITNDMFTFQNAINSTMQDVGMFHDESMGGGGNMSGIAIAQKQAGDIFNVSEAVDNLAIFISAIFKYILALASKKYVVSRTIYDESDDDRGYIIIGDVENSRNDAIKLKDFESIDVKIVPSGVYSDVQLKQEMMELFNLKLIDTQSMLEAYKVGETRKVLERLEDERMRAEGLTPDIEKAIKQAEKDFETIIKGRKVEMPKVQGDKSKAGYLQYFIQNLENQQLDDNTAKRLTQHIQKVTKHFGIPQTQPIGDEQDMSTGEVYKPKPAQQEQMIEQGAQDMMAKMM